MRTVVGLALVGKGILRFDGAVSRRSGIYACGSVNILSKWCSKPTAYGWMNSGEGEVKGRWGGNIPEAALLDMVAKGKQNRLCVSRRLRKHRNL